MKCTFGDEELTVWQTVPLGNGLAVGRKNAFGASEPLRRSDGVPTLALETSDHSIGVLGDSDCQILVTKVGHCYFAEDRNASSLSARLNDSPFTRSRLLVNDRLSVGDGYHFHFDGIGLCRVPDSQGGRVEVHHLTKVYPAQRLGGSEVTAVSDMNLTIEPNEFVGILGPSGCGKSTLLGMLCGAIKPSHGVVKIDGIDISQEVEKRQSLVGIVPQDDIVHMELTVWQAVRLSALLRLPQSIPLHEKEDLAVGVIAKMGLWEHRHHVISQLSGGQRKRVSIGVEILKKSSVFFLDEPSSGLDQAREEDLMILLKQMSNQGRTIICTTHILDRAYLFSKIIVISRGIPVYVGRADDAPAYFGLESLNEVYRHVNDPNYMAIPFGVAPERWKETHGIIATDTSDIQVSEVEETDSYRVETHARGSLVKLTEPMTPAVVAAVSKLIDDEEPLVVLDLTAVVSQSANDLDLLKPVVQRLRLKHGNLEIVATEASVREWLSANRLEDTLALRGTVDYSRLSAKAQEAESPQGLSAMLLTACVGVIAAFAWVVWKLVLDA